MKSILLNSMQCYNNNVISSNISKARYETLLNWNLDKVKSYLVNRNISDKSIVEDLEIEYKRFILMNLIYPNRPIPISQEVDKIWHTHILFTQDYMKFSKNVNNGRYLHHLPTLDEKEQASLKDEFETNTLEIYRSLFGEPNLLIWGKDTQVCKCCYSDSNDD